MSEELACLTVPQGLIDLSGWGLSGKNKLNVLRYLDLEETLSKQGIIKIDEHCAENIPLGPVRDYFSKKLSGKEIEVNFAERELPITFRTYLAVGALTTNIVDYLKERGEVEIYASDVVGSVLSKADLKVNKGALNYVEFGNLPKGAQRDLIMPLIGDLSGAKIVKYAGYLFPEGIEVRKIFSFEPSIIFKTLKSGLSLEGNILFNDPSNLEIKSRMAGLCVENYQKIKFFELVKELKEMQEEGTSTEDEPDSESDDEPKEQFTLYPEGTKLYDIFPLKEGETKEDLYGAYKSLYDYGGFGFELPYEDDGSFAYMILEPSGTLVMIHEIKNFIEPIATQKIDALSGKYSVEYYEDDEGRENEEGSLEDNPYMNELRHQGVSGLIQSLRTDLDHSRQAIDKAKQKRGTTAFIIEKNVLDALRYEYSEDITKSALAAYSKNLDSCLVYIPKQEEPLTKLPARAVVLTNKKALEIDYRILTSTRRVHEEEDFNPFSIFDKKRDGLADWFDYSNHLLQEYGNTLPSSTKLFEMLNIPPTDDSYKIRSAYRTFVKKLHPDRLQGQDLEKAEQKDSKEKLIEVILAYNTLNERLQKGGLAIGSPVYYLGRISKLFEGDEL